MSIHPGASRKPVVLIVDDEPLIRMNIADAVDAAGMQAIEAGDADEALRLLQHEAEVDIVVSDVKMPGSMDGCELARVVAERWPALRIVMMSGHAYACDMDREVSFFPKPFPLPSLINELGRLSAAPV